MKHLILVVLSFVALNAAANERGGGAGVGGGGLDEIEFIRQMYPELSKCDVVQIMLDRHSADMLPEDTLVIAEECGLLD